jgi:quercetin dioxygenase-like cupin family protein
MKFPLSCLLAAAVLTLPASAPAQQRTGIKSVPILTKDVTGAPGREMTILSIELAPGGASGLHTHPGDEHGTVLEGTLMLKVGNEEFKPVTAGQTFSVAPETPMEIKNAGSQTVKVMNVLILEKGKPRSTQVHGSH